MQKEVDHTFMPRRKNKEKFRKSYTLIVWIIIVSAFVINKITSVDAPEKNEIITKKHQKNISPVVKQINIKIEQVKQLEQDKKYNAAIEMMESIVEEVQNSTEFTEPFKSYVWHLKTHLHLRLWQYADAKMALTKAMHYASAKQYLELQKQSDWLDNIVERSNIERNKFSSYTASPNVGPSGKFTGEIGIIHLFLQDKSSKDWGLKQRTISLTAMDNAKDWFKSEADKYGKSVDFKQRVYLIDRNPAIKRLSLGTNKKQYRYANAIVKLAVNQLGEKTVLGFLYKHKKLMQVNEVMLLVHLNMKGRSFAKRCLFRCAAMGEYTYILEEAVIKKWQSMEYAQAHESLHLFGADDLYNIKQSTYFATRDIMNYQSKYLDASVIEPVTAYSIGLITEKPETPFKIKTVRY